jgi:hypothetical protein
MVQQPEYCAASIWHACSTTLGWTAEIGFRCAACFSNASEGTFRCARACAIRCSADCLDASPNLPDSASSSLPGSAASSFENRDAAHNATRRFGFRRGHVCVQSPGQRTCSEPTGAAERSGRVHASHFTETSGGVRGHTKTGRAEFASIGLPFAFDAVRSCDSAAADARGTGNA